MTDETAPTKNPRGLPPIQYPESSAWGDPDELPEVFAKDLEAFHDSVICPVLEELLKKCNGGLQGRSAQSSEEHDELERHHILYQETAKAFWLTLASRYERQTREYLTRFGNKLDRTDIIKVIDAPSRDDVLNLLSAITGDDLEPEGSRLKEFMLVANVCRHGPGASLKTLHKLYHKNWWPSNLWLESHAMPLMYNLQIGSDQLNKFAGELSKFWRNLDKSRGERYMPPIAESKAGNNKNARENQ